MTRPPSTPRRSAASSFVRSSLAGLLAGIAAFVVVGLWHVEPAAACGACVCDPGYPWLAADGARDAPTNARLLLSAPGVAPEEVHLLLGLDGPEVPIRREPSTGHPHVIWLVPETPLAESQLHAVVAGVSIFTFTTGVGEDATAPTLAGATLVDGELGGLCESSRGARVKLGARTEERDAAWPAVEVEVTGPEGTLRTFLMAPGNGFDLGTTVGEQSCLGDGELGALAEGSHTVRVRVLDLAGQASDFVEAGQAEFLPSEPGGCGPPRDPAGESDGEAPAAAGCAAGGSGSSIPWVLLALVPILARRRSGRSVGGTRCSGGTLRHLVAGLMVVSALACGSEDDGEGAGGGCGAGCPPNSVCAGSGAGGRDPYCAVLCMENVHCDSNDCDQVHGYCSSPAGGTGGGQ